MKTTILYHASCQDGFCSAFIMDQYLRDTEAKYIPVHYQTEPPWDDIQDARLFILDFSYPINILLLIWKRCQSLVLLDHHLTAKDDLMHFIKLCQAEDPNKMPPVIEFDMTRSGAMITWDYTHPEMPAPWYVNYVQDRDLWQWKLHKSREINAGLALLPYDFKEWNKGLLFGPQQLEIEGTAVLKYQQKLIDSACKNAVEIDMAGHKVLTVNTTVLMSEIGEQLCKGRDFSATYFINGQGEKIWSLRSEEFDVGAFAKNFGGGGHKQAAGYKEKI